MSRNKDIGFHKQTHQVGKYRFNFKEASTDDYLRAYKNGDEFSLVIFVTAVDLDTGEIIANYERCWENSNSSTGEMFVRKFLADADFREKYRCDGICIDDVQDKKEEIVNRKCAERIVQLNVKDPKNLRFKDFASLKTFGRDKVSGMKYEELENTVTKEQLELIKSSVDDQYVLPVLRWHKRGLFLDLAIRKVKTDVEIAQNAMPYKKW